MQRFNFLVIRFHKKIFPIWIFFKWSFVIIQLFLQTNIFLIVVSVMFWLVYTLWFCSSVWDTTQTFVVFEHIDHVFRVKHLPCLIEQCTHLLKSLHWEIKNHFLMNFSFFEEAISYDYIWGVWKTCCIL